jgi:hypothetical protein
MNAFLSSLNPFFERLCSILAHMNNRSKINHLNMKTLVSIVLIICFNSIYSQKKIATYFDENLNEINESEFNALTIQPNYQYNTYELNDQVANIAYKRKTTGKLSLEEFDLLKQALKFKGNLNNKLTVIIFIPSLDNCNKENQNSTWNVFDRDYLKKLGNISDFNHFWIYKNDENLKYYYPKKNNWQFDNDQVIEKIFFKMHYPCFSFVVIDEYGNYISNFGEFGKQTVWEYSRELLKR